MDFFSQGFWLCCFLKFMVFDVLVAQVEPASTVDSQPVEDPPTMKFTWTIESFSRLNTKKHYSDMFIVGGYKWYSALANHMFVRLKLAYFVFG